VKEYSPYQEKIIKRYYENRDSIMQQKIAELTTDLFLAEGKKRTQVWKRIGAALTQLKVPQEIIDELTAADDSAALAEWVKSNVKWQ
jgi:hypothetical protein